MNSLLDEEIDEMHSHDRELTLGTGTILGIFFGLVLLCGLIFGLGYKMGERKPIVVEQGSVSSGPAADFGAFKPAAGSPVGTAPSVPRPAVSTPVAANSAGNVPRPVAAAETVRPAPAPVAAAPAGPASGSGFVVQIAAVSHQEDAELLVNALRAKGYPVSANTSAQDKFFHIQVGPFVERRDAEAAKQRLVADGYQPIVK